MPAGTAADPGHEGELPRGAAVASARGGGFGTRKRRGGRRWGWTRISRETRGANQGDRVEVRLSALYFRNDPQRLFSRVPLLVDLARRGAGVGEHLDGALVATYRLAQLAPVQTTGEGPKLGRDDLDALQSGGRGRTP